MASLEAIPSPEEIAAVVFSLGPDRAPGPDGITTRFVQTFWPDIKVHVEHEVITSSPIPTCPGTLLNPTWCSSLKKIIRLESRITVPLVFAM